MPEPALFGRLRRSADGSPTILGVPLPYWGMRSVLDQLGFHAVMPRPVGPIGRSGSPGSLEKKGLNYSFGGQRGDARRLDRLRGLKCALCAMVRFARSSCYRGRLRTKFSQGQRGGINLALCVDGVGGKLSWLWMACMHHQEVLRLIAHWNEDGFDAIVWDNASSHVDEDVQYWGMPLI